MIQKFEETGDLDVIRGSGRKRILKETVEEVALDIVERESDFQYSVSSGPAVLRELSLC